MIDNKKLYELRLDGNTFYVLWYLSYGYDWALNIGKEYYEASFSQIREHTGIKDNHTIIKCIKKLVDMGLITYSTDWVNGKQKSTSKFTSNVVEKIHHSSGKIPPQKWKKSTTSSGKNPQFSKEKESKEITKENTKEDFFSFEDSLVDGMDYNNKNI
jgi:hypothetical protein